MAARNLPSRSDLPLIAPRPPRLSAMGDGLRAIEARGIFSNGGPVVRGFEAEARARLFGGAGDCLAVTNATLGLMIALRQATAHRPGGLALMPALTFAATAQAAMWAGLTPLVCDIDRARWIADPDHEEALLARHGAAVSAIVPYATFGHPLDLDRYAALAERHGVAVVIDAAASLGCTGEDGRNFGAGAPFAVVYSMHATKTFATGEGGLIHSGDRGLVAALRQMSNFGFDGDRRAQVLGINAKLPEIAGLMALAKLDELEAVAAHRAVLADAWRALLPACGAQSAAPGRQTYQFWSALLPREMAPHRAAIIARLADEGIGAGQYFSPHLGEQPFLQSGAWIEPTPVADDIAARLLSLPITDGMAIADVERACAALGAAIAGLRPDRARRAARVARPPQVETALIGGGPAGTAVLTALSKHGRLEECARRGLAIIERDDRLGRGALGTYAVRSDTTAETFLSAVRDHPQAALAALAGHRAAQALAAHADAPGAPLVEAGAFVEATGERLGRIVACAGATMMTGHRAIAAHRLAGDLWRTVTVDRGGAEHAVISANIVIATGGYQSHADTTRLRVAGAPLGALAGPRLMLADAVMRVGGLAAVRQRLASLPAPRIVVIGGSTSAIASANLLLTAAPALPLGPGAITVLHRRPLRPFYPSREAALADGFGDFTEEDICPVSGFVYRLGGLRLESRELVLRMLGIGGRVPEPRIALHRLAGEADAEARALIAGADLVIAATGYRPHALPLHDLSGARIALACEGAEPGPLVDRHCRVIDAHGQPVRGAWGIGLAAGFVPWGSLGGEPSFRGKANGLWLWQNDVGMMIGEALLSAHGGAGSAVA
ncbi:MAG: DegT/DnrJ/EryC1/StrS family aminotransferase [Sphingomonadales bacterium]|nr:DegT/DnrJ/EryC1/StrS family aminotransferase [Sphingomonadales bacterium]